jgi:hypothetical protein
MFKGTATAVLYVTAKVVLQRKGKSMIIAIWC